MTLASLQHQLCQLKLTTAVKQHKVILECLLRIYTSRSLILQFCLTPKGSWNRYFKLKCLFKLKWRPFRVKTFNQIMPQPVICYSNHSKQGKECWYFQLVYGMPRNLQAFGRKEAIHLCISVSAVLKVTVTSNYFKPERMHICVSGEYHIFLLLYT